MNSTVSNKIITGEERGVVLGPNIIPNDSGDMRYLGRSGVEMNKEDYEPPHMMYSPHRD